MSAEFTTGWRNDASPLRSLFCAIFAEPSNGNMREMLSSAVMSKLQDVAAQDNLAVNLTFFDARRR